MRSSLKRFHKKDFFMHLYFKSSHGSFFISIAPFLHGCKHPNCSHAFSTIIGRFFRGDVCMKSHWSQDKVLEYKVSNWRDFISGDFLIKGLYFTGLF